jgi:glycosyltransferase involved in cell wall biosynthesis
MPVKNGAEFLPETLETILSQIKQEDEVIVIDDGSIDSTANILQFWSERYIQLRVIRTKGVGLVHALNLGLSESQNDWIARYDVDDKYPKNRLSEQRKLIGENVGAIFCDYSLWSNKVRSIGVLPNAIQKSAIAVSLSNSQRTPHPGVVFNREKVLSVGGYQENDFPAEDLSLWLRLSNISELIGVPEVLLNYRISSTSISGTMRDLAVMKSREVRQNYPINFSDLKFVEKNLAEIFQIYNQFPYSSERKILLIADLIKAQELSGLKRALNLKTIVKLLVEVKTYNAGLNLLKTKLLKKNN